MSGITLSVGGLTLENPVFRAYVIASGLMVIKMMSMSWLTVSRMMQENGGMRNPEDENPGAFNKNPRRGQAGPNERVDRIRRIHANDIENIPLFVASGFLFVYSDPSPVVAMALFYGYVLTRMVHFWAYLTARSHELRATFWTPGSLIVLYMAGAAVFKAIAG